MLDKYQRRFNAIFSDPNILVGLVDPDGTTLDINETAIGYIDSTRDEVIGMPFWETPWWAEESQRNVKEWIARAADNEYVTYEATHPTDEKELIVVKGSFRPVTDESENTTAIIVSATDITEQRLHKRELKQQNERLDEFASFVSHDLQTPISTVKGRLELALETGEMEHVRKAFDAIDRVDELREDLVNTLRSKEVVTETETVNIESTLEAVWTAIDPSASATFEVIEDPHIEADPEALQRMLENLVSNSIEHGNGDITIEIGEFEDGIYYEDNGPGIDPENRDKVFTPGFSTKNGEGGIGIGMASVRQIVLGHDWEIHIHDANRLDGVRFEILTSQP
jgi:PAS domain S-box-containing protein